LSAHAPGTGKESQHVFPGAPYWPLRSDLGKITSAGFVVISLLKVQYVTSRWPMEDWDERARTSLTLLPTWTTEGSLIPDIGREDCLGTGEDVLVIP
jgi:hypothetical protein